jgi:hypothetical protein
MEVDMEVDAAMGVDLGEDVDWMNEDVGPVDQDPEYNELVETCRLLESRENNGKITEEESFRLSKARQRLNNLKRLNASAAQGNASLFVGEASSLRRKVTSDDVFEFDESDFGNDDHQPRIFDDSETELSRLLREEIEDDDIRHQPASTSKPASNSKSAKPRKPRRKPSDAKEAYERTQEDKRERERSNDRNDRITLRRKND